MNVLNIILQIVLLVIGLGIVVAVMFQKGKGGLSTTIAGGSDSFMDRDKSANTNRLLNKFTLIGSIVFVVLVVIVYVIQPDYAQTTYAVNDTWKEISEFAEALK